ncbi:Uma2 family endonuclease [Spirosoma soli]|uniref:Uma2 family endonuclease n=1 Tax=Spirosoma soli TaxID=1770529 RepID=A0ABW5M507_9BACT
MILPINLPVQDGRFSDDELFAFCQMNPKLRIERDENGQIFINMPTGIETSFKNSALIAETYMWNRQTKLGRVSDSNGGYTLPDSSMRAPDVAWISHERLATVSPEDLKKFAHVCPDFVIELASESDDLVHLKKKMEKYLQNGVRLAWLVDPFGQQTIIYHTEGNPITKSFTEELSGEDVLPGFAIKLQDLM